MVASNPRIPPRPAAVNCADGAAGRRLRGGALAGAALALAACHAGDAPPISAAFGSVDDAKAAQIGRLTLESGGNAVDAAVAMGLTMVATLPSRVGLGGGGVCVVHDPGSKTVRTLDFLPVPAASGRTPPPLLLRGLYTLHSAYGRQHWEQALGVAESLAAVGTPVSRTLAADLKAAASRLAVDPAARRTYLNAAGTPPVEGETLTQTELSATLRTVRQRGVGAFYTSTLSGSLGGAVAAGLGADAAALAAQAEWVPTLAVENDNNVVHLPMRRGGAESGLPAAWQAASADGAWLGALIGALGPSGGAAAPGASLAVVDTDEQGVACTFTLGGLFGSGRLAPELGVFAGGPAGAGGVGGPALMVNPHQHTTLFAGAASAGDPGEGARAGDAAVLAMLRRVGIDGTAGPQAITAPRAAPAAGGGVAAEAGVAPAALGSAAASVRPAQSLARIEAVACLYDRRKGSKSCEAVPDPRGAGLNFTVLK